MSGPHDPLAIDHLALDREKSITLHRGGPRQLTEIKTLNFDKTQ